MSLDPAVHGPVRVRVAPGGGSCSSGGPSQHGYDTALTAHGACVPSTGPCPTQLGKCSVVLTFKNLICMNIRKKALRQEHNV